MIHRIARRFRSVAFQTEHLKIVPRIATAARDRYNVVNLATRLWKATRTIGAAPSLGAPDLDYIVACMATLCCTQSSPSLVPVRTLSLKVGRNPLPSSLQQSVTIILPINARVFKGALLGAQIPRVALLFQLFAILLDPSQEHCIVPLFSGSYVSSDLMTIKSRPPLV
jgi:hypothetical protein